MYTTRCVALFGLCVVFYNMRMFSFLSRYLSYLNPFSGYCTGVPDLCFGPACKAHDEDYEEGSDAYSQKKTDRRFLVYMLYIANSYYFMKYVLILVAYMYYIGVRIFGRGFWKRG